MKIRRLLAFTLSAALGLTLCLPGASALEEKEDTGYLFRMKETAVMPLSAAEEIQPVPYAEGYYTVDSLEDLQPWLDAGLVETVVPDVELELLGEGDGGTEPGGDTPASPNDPGAAQQWYLDELGMDEVWASGLDGSGVTVAIIDSGLVQNHEDLNYTNITGHNFLSAEGSVDIDDWADTTGHGSLVSGIVAAQMDNGVGVAGLADGVNLLMLRCFAAENSGFTGSGTVSTILSAIEYAIDQDVDVISMSFGGTKLETLSVLKEPLERAAAQGILLVAAAGNDNSTAYRYPAAFDCVTGVGGVGQDGTLYANTQRNDSVFLTAPAVGIYNIGYTAGDSYRSDTGTSMATPMVAAMAALAKQADSAIDTDGFRTLLKASVTDGGEAGYDTSYGWGYLSAADFVRALTADQTITYACGEGTLPAEGDWSNTYRIGAGDQVVLPAPTWEGHDFTGWYLTEDCSGDPVTAIPAGSVGAVTLYAGWKEQTAPEPEPEPEPELPAVAERQESQTGSAVPASLDGLTEVQPYTADVSGWFTNAETYALSAQPEAGTAELAGSTLTYTPTAEAAGQTVTFTLCGVSGEEKSGDVTVSVAVAALPVSDARLEQSDLSYDLYTQTGGVTVGLSLYGNQLTGVSAGETPLAAGTDYALADGSIILTHALLSRLGEGTHTLTLTFDNGRTEAAKQASLTITVTDTTPVTPPPDPDPGTGGGSGGGSTGGGTGGGGGISGGGSGGGGAAPAEEPDLELLESRDGAFRYALTDGTAALAFDEAQLDKLAAGEAVLDLSGVEGVTAAALNGADAAALTGGVTLSLPAGRAAFSPELTAKLAEAAGEGTVTVTLCPAEKLTAAQQTAAAGRRAYTFAVSTGDSARETLSAPAVLTLPWTPEDTSPVVPAMALLAEDGTLTPLETGWDPLAGTLTAETGSTGVILLTSEPWASPFADVSEADWFYQAVGYVCAAGIMEGNSGTFLPEGTVTRGMIAVMLYRLEGEPEPGAGQADFTDVAEDAYYARAVRWAQASGVINGYGEGRFGPEDPVTREQLAAILFRYAGYRSGESPETDSGVLAAYGDSAAVSDWARSAMAWAVETGIINGRTEECLDPSGTAARAEAATIFQRWISLLCSASD